MPSSYKPAEVPANSGVVFSTEHIDTGFVDSKNRLFVAPGTGQVLEFEIASSGPPDPLLPRLFSPDLVWSKPDPLTAACLQGAAVAGLTVSMDRLFVYANADPNVIRIYSWNRATGVILDPAFQEYSQSYFLPPDPNPVDPSNATSGRCYRARFHTTNPVTGEGYAYFACEPYLLQMHWPGSGANTLDFTGWWRSDYDHALQDCRFYDVPGFGSGILTVKDGESFALVGE